MTQYQIILPNTFVIIFIFELDNNMETNGVAISQFNVNFILPTKTFQQYFIT